MKCRKCGREFDADDAKVLLDRLGADGEVICPECQPKFPRNRQFTPSDPYAVAESGGDA
ncbi:hypothetical protein [Halorussus halobius]|uniref:hypothetical protein n=1 Tax=Halorussus halobius TaxID=1710537 RepID=UPI00143D21A5|nr:hypothetical protein [Halorussus halobius]